MKLLSDFSSHGSFSFRKVMNYVFPKGDYIEPNITQNKWVKTLAYINPLLACLLMVVIFYWPKYLMEKVGIFEPLAIFTMFLCLISLLISLIPTLFLLCCAAILKVKKRSPFIPLSLTLIYPLKAAIFIGFINLLGYAFFPNSMLLSDSAKCRLVKKAYLETHPGEKSSNETFWGFRPGHDTYLKVVEILKHSNADFEESGYLHNPKLPLIKINSYSHFSGLAPLTQAELLFDKYKRLYSIKLIAVPSENWMHSWEKKSPNIAFSNLRSLFYAKYYPLMQKSRLDEPEGHFFSPSGVKIQVHAESAELTVPILEEHFLTLKKQVEEEAKIEQGKQFTHLIQ